MMRCSCWRPWFSDFLSLAALAVLLVVPVSTTGAASFVVDSPASFQAALTSAESNGESDTITVQAGTYAVVATLEYVSTEPWSLTITGAGAGVGGTTLDGGDAVRVISLRATGAGAALEVAQLAIRHGASVNDFGGGLSMETSTGSLTLTDLILWHDQPDEIGFSSASGTATLEVRYSDVEGGTGHSWFGTGCIDLDPLFVNPAGGNLQLSWDHFPTPDGTMSPCIDAGDPASPPDPDGSRVDMGALPFDQLGFIFADGFESGDTMMWSVKTR
jgi:hypothetical protein